MQKYYWALISSVPGLGSGTIRKLKKEFQSGEEVVKASKNSLLKSNCFINQDAVDNFMEYRKKFDLDQFIELLTKHKVRLMSIEDSDYPKELKEIYNAPEILYCKGEFPDIQKRIAIVGSRRCSPYGEQVAKDFARGLAKAGFVIVSGAAIGIDAAAHWGAITQGKTIGVLGCGIDKVYPFDNIKLYNEIEKHGVLITEYPFGMRPLAANFPARNRIIAGMCQGILVVEGEGKSGSLITAEFASSEGRDVFAIPGSIYSPNSIGTHRLIQEGAKLVTNVDDIIQEYEILHNKKGEKAYKQEPLTEINLNLSPDETIIYKALDYTIPIGVDELIYKLRDKVSNISFVLLQMKLKGIIQEPTPNFYIKSNRGAFHE